MDDSELVEVIASAIWDVPEQMTARVAYKYLEESSKEMLRYRAINVLRVLSDKRTI